MGGGPEEVIQEPMESPHIHGAWHGPKAACLSLLLSSVFTTKLQEHIVLQDREELGPMDARQLVLNLIIRLAPNHMGGVARVHLYVDF